MNKVGMVCPVKYTDNQLSPIPSHLVLVLPPFWSLLTLHYRHIPISTIIIPTTTQIQSREHAQQRINLLITLCTIERGFFATTVTVVGDAVSDEFAPMLVVN
jgi:hypothetical protein